MLPQQFIQQLHGPVRRPPFRNMGNLTWTFCFVVASCCFFWAGGSPRGSKRSDAFDQKQSGNYNFRLNLKDFQIIALLEDDDSSSASDSYEYEYEMPSDYFEVSSPTSNSTVDNTTHNSSATTTTSNGTATTPSFPHVNNPSSSTQTSFTNTPTTPTSTHGDNSQVTSTTEKSSSSSTAAAAPSGQATTSPHSHDADAVNIFSDKIPVFIMQPHLSGGRNGIVSDTTSNSSSASLSVVVEDSVTEKVGDQVRPVVSGEIVHYKRCSQGYARDKRGRCRKLRRPHVSFNLGRLASNLASKFKYTRGGSP